MKNTEKINENNITEVIIDKKYIWFRILIKNEEISYWLEKNSTDNIKWQKITYKNNIEIDNISDLTDKDIIFLRNYWIIEKFDLLKNITQDQEIEWIREKIWDTVINII